MPTNGVLRGHQSVPGFTAVAELGGLTGAPTSTTRTTLLLPDAPLFQAPRTHLVTPSLVVGTVPRAAAAVMLGVTGAGLVAPVAHAQETSIAVANPADVAAVSRSAAALDRARPDLSPEELARQRNELWRSYVHAANPTADRTMTRGEAVMSALSDELAMRMMVTARDLANPGSYQPIEGRPDLKAIPEADVQRLVRDAVQRIPISELPGGDRLSAALSGLPGLGGRDVGSMSYVELRRAVSDGARGVFEQHFGAFFTAHKVETVVAAFAGVTAARAASPEAARVLNTIIPRIKVWGTSFWSGAGRVDASLRYRETRVLPDLDATASAARRVGVVDLRATATATVPLDRPADSTGAVGVGARLANPNAYLDLSGAIDTRDARTVRLEAGRISLDGNTILSTAVEGRYGPGAAVGTASGRVTGEVSLEHRIRSGRDVEGTVGAFVGASVDSDGQNPDARAGVMLRLRF